MDRRNILISIGVTGLLAACGSVPRTPAPTASAPSSPQRRPEGSADRPFGDNVDPLEAMLAADRDPRRSDVVTVAMSQVGIPYLWGGGSPVIGFDCSGFVAYVFREALHLDLPRVSYDQARTSQPIDDGDLRAADLVFFNTLRREFSHVGIYVGRQRFVHAPATGAFVRIERLGGEYWRARYNGARRVLV
jgi:cell wall-associated NlpC family hydrolase